MAKKDGLYVSVGADVSGYKKSWEEIATVTKAGGKTLEQEAAAMALKVAKKIEGMGITTQARQLQNLTAKMMEAGLEGTKAFTQVAAAGGKLRAQMDDAKGVIEAMRPDAPFKALSTTLGAAAQGFAGVQGAMALFGAESEETQKVLLKVQAAMAFSEGFKALDGLEDGFKQLNLTIKANPLIAGAAIFAAAAAGIALLAYNTSDFAHKQEILNGVTKETIELAKKEYANVSDLIKIATDEAQSKEVRVAALKKLKAQYPDYLKNINDENIGTATSVNQLRLLNQEIIRQAQVMAIRARIQEVSNKLIDAQIEYQKELNKGAAQYSKEFAAGHGRAGDMSIAEYVAKKHKEAQKEFDAARAAVNADTELLASMLRNGTMQKALLTTLKDNSIATTTIPTGGGSNSSGSRSAAQTEAVSPTIANHPFIDFKAEGEDAKQFAITVEDSLTDAAVSYDVYSAQVAARQANIAAAAAATADAFVTLGGVISKSMMDAAGNSATAFDAFSASIVEVVLKLAGMAMANAITAATQSAAFFGPGAIFALPAFIATAIGGVTSAFAAAASFKPKGFAEGGLIGGSSYSGDRLLAPVNSGEVVLNTGQQNALLRMANGGGAGSGNLVAKFTGRDLLIMYDNARKDYNRG